MYPFPNILPPPNRPPTLPKRKVNDWSPKHQESHKLQEYYSQIKNLKDIDDTCIKSLGKRFNSLDRKVCQIIFKLETIISNFPELTHFIDVWINLRVKLYFKKLPVPLPERLSPGRNTFLTSKAMVVNFISFLSERSQERNKTLDKVNRFKHYERPVYSYDMILFALELHLVPYRHRKWKGKS